MMKEMFWRWTVMYTSFYGMYCNPFLKDESIKFAFKSRDFNEALSRFNYLKEINGIGLFTGFPGVGKTYVARYFINNLNKDLYKVIYISANKSTSLFNFVKLLCDSLNLNIGSCYHANIYSSIQSEFKRLVSKDKVSVVVIIDDAHLLPKDVIDYFKIFYDFDMDSKDYVSLILIGLPELKAELSKNIYETLKQRIIVNYSFDGLSRDEVKEYIISRLEYANSNTSIFNQEAISALYSCSKSLPRRLNALAINSLMLGFQNNNTIIDSNIVMNAKNEIDFDQ